MTKFKLKMFIKNCEKPGVKFSILSYKNWTFNGFLIKNIRDFCDFNELYQNLNCKCL